MYINTSHSLITTSLIKRHKSNEYQTEDKLKVYKNKLPSFDIHG